VSRNLYILAATLLLFSLVSCAMLGTVSSTQPDLPGNGSLWKTTSLFLFLGAVLAAFAAVMTAMFEQVERRNEERERRQGRRGH
jgi:predicted outer membrane lipoprotein